MDKYLLEIFVPASGQTLDVWVPKQSKLFEVAWLLSGAMAELSQGELAGTDEMVLCDRHSGSVLDINQTVEELGLLNGSKLMLL